MQPEPARERDQLHRPVAATELDQDIERPDDRTDLISAAFILRNLFSPPAQSYAPASPPVNCGAAPPDGPSDGTGRRA